ncbi:MAG: thiolase domain-containing protein [Gammaproteobacteria bacterium]|uniref:thiolase C-terminal domain-containing protein n=1 Tax=Pseudomaricurvus alcaniphilus TaxID=1166482 RepID=UPI00140B0A86|nr:beta-ketoacyl synthase N-terminal-like domain-containing protein [Pseudomaricurvus alcaniphilus]MBR9909728.1 thiolase domain-containing protein [Gammaproteobacteria bacterium]NHN38447.1 thiolase domain-containing protein [Pseudomaricurvus alcaniphilus]
MKDVYLIGIGQTKINKSAGIRGRYLAAQAIEQALSSAGIDKQQVGMLVTGNMMSGMLSQQQQLGALIADTVGLRGIEASTVEAACSSGAAATRWGYMSVAGGFHDVVAVCGVERMTHSSREDTTAALATAADWELEGCNGDSFISLNARLMKLYMQTYGVTAEDFGHFAINAHENGFTNPNAFLQKQIDMDTYLGSRMLVDPVKLFDAPPVCDGSAAVILASEEVARSAARSGLPLVKISGSAIGTDSLALNSRANKLELSGAALSTQRAMQQAGVKHADIDIFELHDAYTIITALSLEAAGFAAKGEGVHFGKNGEISRTGKLPISTMGGLKSRGHPVGATGLYQLAETYMQLTGTAGVNQVADAEVALVQNIGGTGATVVSHILQRA